MKTTIAVVVILALAVLGIYAYQETRVSLESYENNISSDEVSKKVKGIDDVESVTSEDISWTFDDMSEDTLTAIPDTRVSVNIQQNVYFAGTYQGSCSVQDVSEPEENEIGRALCWYAGGGDEIGVYKENGRLYIKHRVVDEGTAEEPGQKGDFETLFTL